MTRNQLNTIIEENLSDSQEITPDLHREVETSIVDYADQQDATKVDKVTGSRLITSIEASKLSNLSGTNTGDQDLTAYALKGGVTSETIVSLKALIDDIETGGGGSAEVYNEVPAGIINGSNATFTTADDFVPESVRVSLNGLRQKRITHFQTTGNSTIIFSDSPLPGDLILIDYTKL